MEPRKKFKRVVPEHINVDDLTILDVVCGTTKCSDGYHCFSQKKTSIRKFGLERVCKECGVDLIDWDRIHKNDIKDFAFTFDSLRSEIIRHVFWHTPIETEALISAHKLGKLKIREAARKLLLLRIGKYNNYMDGRQTPMGKDEIINYAQHATATCCRKCLEAWHNIKLEKQLNEEEITFCLDLVMKYIEERLPLLENEGVSEEEVQAKLRYEKH